jgi:hypothetical protein
MSDGVLKGWVLEDKEFRGGSGVAEEMTQALALGGSVADKSCA